jgi:hypothetical protein
MIALRRVPGVAAILLMTVAGARWQPAHAVDAASTPRPRLVIESTEHDAGKVAANDVVRAVFMIRNAGTAPLSILGLKKDCGCLVPSYDEEIAPGATGRVRMTLRTHGFQGPIEKHVYLETDDPDARSVVLTVKAVVPRIIEITPGPELVLPVTRGKATTVDVTLQSTDAGELALGMMDSSETFVTVALAPGAVSEGRAVRLRVTVAADAPTDTFEAVIVIETGHVRQPRAGLKLFAQPAAAVTVRPARLAYGRIQPDARDTIERLLTLSHPTRPFRILKVEDSLGCLRFEAGAATEPTYRELKVIYSEGWKDEQTAGVIRITTDDPARPLIEVPYTAEVW